MLSFVDAVRTGDLSIVEGIIIVVLCGVIVVLGKHYGNTVPRWIFDRLVEKIDKILTLAIRNDERNK